MATVGLYGSVPNAESVGLYGNNNVFAGTYFEWFIFQVGDTQPTTPTGGSWDFTTNTGTPPTGWLATPPVNPSNIVWVSIGLVNSRSSVAIVWSVPGKFSFASGLTILSGTGSPSSGLGVTDQLYIQTDTTPETIWFKQVGTWTRMTGSTLYADLTSNQTLAGTKTFSSPIAGSVTGTSANITGIAAIANGGTGTTTANGAFNALAPSQTGNSGKFLTTDGSNSSWSTNPLGTVTSVAVSGGTTGLTASGGPITTSGTITLAGTLAVANGGTGVTTSTGSGNTVLSTSPLLTTPTLSGAVVGNSAPYLNFNSTTAPTYNSGRFWYDSTQDSLAFNNVVTNNTIHLGQEVQLRVLNSTGSTIAAGNVVYVTSTASGQVYPNVALAKADALATAVVMGMANQAIPTGTVGYVTTAGVVAGISTGTYAVGDVLYLSPYSAGQIMNTLPPTGYPVKVGVVSYANSPNGQIYINQANSFVQAANVVGVVAAVNGGTGQSSYAVGDLVYASTTTALSKLADVATGNALISGGVGTAPSYGKVGLTTHVSGTLATTNGGTGLTSFTANGVVYASSTSALATGSALTFDGSYFIAASGTGTFLADILQVSGAPTKVNSSGVGLEFRGGANTSITAYSRVGSAYLPFTLDASASIFSISGSEQMRLTSTGLGIGTSSPVAGTKLTLQESASNGSALAMVNRNSTQTWKIAVDAAAVDDKILAFIDNGTSTVRMALTDTGNLGLGVTPSALSLSNYKTIEVAYAGNGILSGLNDVVLTSNAYFNSGYKYGASNFASIYNQNNGQHIWKTAPSGTAGNAITFTQAMSLTAAGELLVGTTSVGDLAMITTVAPASRRGISAKTVTSAYGVLELWNADTTGNNDFVDFYTEAGQSVRGSITYNRAGGLTAYNVTSDYRAKDIIGPVVGSGELIDSVPVYMGKMKDATQARPMFIAHETPAYAHTGEKDAVDADGKPVYQQMDASALVPVMWAEIQDLRKRLAVLESN